MGYTSLVGELYDQINGPGGLASGSLSVNTVASSGSAQTLPDVTVAQRHRITLTASCTITLPTPAAGKEIVVTTVQDGTGGRIITWAVPSGALKWPGGAAPTYTTSVNSIDRTVFICDDGTNWEGSPSAYDYR